MQIDVSTVNEVSKLRRIIITVQIEVCETVQAIERVCFIVSYRTWNEHIGEFITIGESAVPYCFYSIIKHNLL